jgi:hypothetical protein
MTVSPMSDNLNIIAALSDRPNATDGLTAAQLKAKYDQGPGLIKTYINGTLVTAIDLSQLGSVNRQAAINGNFAVNQLVKSGTVTLTAGAYGHDMWKAGASGCTYTFSTSNNVTTITITAGSLIQVIEGINLFSGTYTLSWTGTSQGKIGAGSYGASGITGTVVGGTNLNIEFNTGTLSKAQFNSGDTALPFQPRSFEEELHLCQRFYHKSYNLGDSPGTVTSSGEIRYIAPGAGGESAPTAFYPRTMRTPPTLTFYSASTGASGKRRNYSTSVDETVSTTVIVGDNKHSGFGIAHTSGSLYGYQYTADARL